METFTKSLGTSLKIAGKISNGLLAVVVLTPLAPVIGLMYLVRHIEADRDDSKFVIVYGEGNCPVRCPKSETFQASRPIIRTIGPAIHPGVAR